jgi:hypothetical protein
MQIGFATLGDHNNVHKVKVTLGSGDGDYLLVTNLTLDWNLDDTGPGTHGIVPLRLGRWNIRPDIARWTLSLDPWDSVKRLSAGPGRRRCRRWGEEEIESLVMDVELSGHLLLLLSLQRSLPLLIVVLEDNHLTVANLALHTKTFLFPTRRTDMTKTMRIPAPVSVPASTRSGEKAALDSSRFCHIDKWFTRKDGDYS